MAPDPNGEIFYINGYRFRDVTNQTHGGMSLSMDECEELTILAGVMGMKKAIRYKELHGSTSNR